MGKEYSSTYDVLVDQSQIVIGFKSMNPFPIWGRSHQQMAEDVASVVREFRAIEEYSDLQAKYNIVGHSLGGKVALMVAAKYDIENVKNIIALDPVDDKPRELTFPRDEPKTNLSNALAEEIHLFQSEKGGEGWMPMCPSDRNATVIQKIYPKKITSLYINKGAGHMSYKDTENDVASIRAREDVQAKIRGVIQ